MPASTNIVIDDRLMVIVDTTGSAFARTALRRALEELGTKELELKHRAGYRGLPVGEQEFSVWEDEQAWGEW